MAALENRPTYLYRHYDKQGKLLYVGISAAPFSRLANHAAQSEWADKIDTVKLERFSTRSAALKAEAKIIRNDAPKFNVSREITGEQMDYIFDETVVQVSEEVKALFEGRDNSRKLDDERIAAIKRELEICQGNVARAARRLGISRVGLDGKIRKAGIDVSAIRNKYDQQIRAGNKNIHQIRKDTR